MQKVKVLVVDDSALMRKIISDMINSQDDMEVIDIARNGQDLLQKLQKHNVDVITLDVEMPVMDGITALRELKERGINIPVIMLSSVSQRGTTLTMECLEAGAFDFIPKPSGAISLDINKVKDELIIKIRMAYDKNNAKASYIKTSTVNNEKAQFLKKNLSDKIEAVVIGASTGGPKALYKVITELPKDLGVPVFIVQHMPVGFTKAFADRLNTNSKITVVEASDGQSIEKNVVYIAPGGFHMEVHSDRKIHLNTEPAMWGVRPAVDKLFISASKVYGPRLVSAVLTGMGRDGAQGTVEIKKNGGITISEDKSTCTIYGMPKAAFETGKVDIILPIDEMAVQIIKLITGR
ncbi:chemotaxis response regulator protein-glutamate methylesterase [Clostridium sp. SYSU_GA19001]|uniref:protein-glutamate methylesterase/protein-glutamine glutaminase n=1 Tax=Clostridium caldaquaticum TaxID=2940653 RepID=UPI0020772CD1|nr:chemotaxis response regulator protein-glutamate methylesterase [Clostridium caldaquaticum]MCM8710944.1 chemotaxis response regulator protein-glutamate methylesterase [Clostridium caldaquaticum]